MRAEDVAHYLQNNPHFFEAHADVLAEIIIPHPHGGRTISLAERQMLALRMNNKELEMQLSEMMEFARENEVLQGKVHQFTLSLFGPRDLIGLQDAITRNIQEIFLVPHAVMRVWKEIPPSAEVLAFADQLQKPVCIHHAVHDTAGWFGDSATRLKSFAYLPLRSGGQSTGLLILSSEDAKRFYPEMGTLFLQRIAEIASGALRPML